MLISSPTAKANRQPCHFKQDPFQISLAEPAQPEHELLGGISSVLVTGWTPRGRKLICPRGGNGPALLAPGGLCVPQLYAQGGWRMEDRRAGGLWGETL